MFRIQTSFVSQKFRQPKNLYKKFSGPEKCFGFKKIICLKSMFWPKTVFEFKNVFKYKNAFAIRDCRVKNNLSLVLAFLGSYHEVSQVSFWVCSSIQSLSWNRTTFLFICISACSLIPKPLCFGLGLVLSPSAWFPGSGVIRPLRRIFWL